MNSANYLTRILIIFFLASLNTGCDKGTGKALGIGETTKDLSIGRMRVAIWPEYDDPSVLVIYDGKFEEVDSYPIKTSFFVPTGSVINDACSLSHKGQHFCQLYKTTKRGEYDEVSLLLPYPNFYLSFHTPNLAAAEQKKFDYRIKANHPIKTMEIDIQQPLRSTRFSIAPAKSMVLSQSTTTRIKGFNHFAYTLDNIPEGQENVFTINYIKSDPKPSVDIKYSRMTGPKVWSSPYETQRNIKTFVYILFGSGVFGVMSMIAWLIWSRKKKQRERLV
jgi:hypothetical protein